MSDRSPAYGNHLVHVGCGGGQCSHCNRRDTGSTHRLRVLGHGRRNSKVGHWRCHLTGAQTPMAKDG
jgi:hypothetical protein